MRTCEKLLATNTVSTCSKSFLSHSFGCHLQAQRDIAVAILVILLEDVRHPLQANTRLHEQIEAQRVASVAVVRAVQECDERLRETVSEGDEGFVEFSVGYTAGMVLVETVEQAAPS